VADDIVTRLRQAAMQVGPNSYWSDSGPELMEAAAEIERLRTAGDALATRLRWWTDDTDASYPDHEALRTWEQARRG